MDDAARCRWLTAALLLGLAVNPAAGSVQDAVSVIERAAGRFQALSGLCADFEQRIDVTLLRQVKESSGELCQEGTDHFEVRFLDPPGDRVVADGTDLWVYFPSTDPGQAFRTPLAGADGRFDLHREFLSEPGERYAATFEQADQIDGEAMQVVSLRPMVPSPYLHARLWIGADDGLIRRLVVLEESESVRTLHLSNHRPDPRLGPEWFRFEPPGGVQVITR